MLDQSGLCWFGAGGPVKLDQIKQIKHGLEDEADWPRISSWLSY